MDSALGLSSCSPDLATSVNSVSVTLRGCSACGNAQRLSSSSPHCTTPPLPQSYSPLLVTASGLCCLFPVVPCHRSMSTSNYSVSISQVSANTCSPNVLWTSSGLFHLVCLPRVNRTTSSCSCCTSSPCLIVIKVTSK